jgi:acetyl esterase
MELSRPVALDHQAQEVIDALNALHPLPVETLEPRVAREQPTPADAAVAVYGQHLLTRTMAPFPQPVGAVTHRQIEGPGGPILLRVYSPDGEPARPRPVVVYFHGGGWVIANLNVYDASPRALVNAADCVVVSVAYRQAPEAPFPAAADDAFAAYRWVCANAAALGGDPARVAVVGESAGGNLATGVALRARDEGVPPPVYQLLIYPVTDQTTLDRPSQVEHADAKPLNTAMLAWFYGHYTPDPAQRAHPYASPLLADLAGLPPATVITAESDPLRSEGEAYAEALRAAGVPVEHHHFDGVMHEFFGMAVVPKAKEAQQAAGADLKRAFGTESY